MADEQPERPKDGLSLSEDDVLDDRAYADWLAQQPLDVQEREWTAVGKGRRARLRPYLAEARKQLWTNWAKGGFQGEAPPGMDRSGGGSGLERDQIQGILTGAALTEAEGLQADQPGIDAYQEDAVLDQGPGYSLLDRLTDEGAFYDESVDGMNLTEYEAAKQVRTDTTGREAQERSLADYDAVIAQEGLTDIDRARIERMRQDTARRGRAQEGAIMADAAERGRASGNLSFLMRNQAQQAATNERALGDMDTAALGLARKDDATRRTPRPRSTTTPRRRTARKPSAGVSKTTTRTRTWTSSRARSESSTTTTRRARTRTRIASTVPTSRTTRASRLATRTCGPRSATSTA
jgi:hypothetical protein